MDRLMRATLAEESMPPERRTPKGTSDMSRFSTPAASSSRDRRTAKSRSALPESRRSSGEDLPELRRLSGRALRDFAVRRSRELLAAGVEKRLMSDVPFGVLL